MTQAVPNPMKECTTPLRGRRPRQRSGPYALEAAKLERDRDRSGDTGRDRDTVGGEAAVRDRH
jgi:hypothetical protein